MIWYLCLIAIIFLALSLLVTILFALKYFGLFDSIEISSGSSPFKYGLRSIVYRIDYGSYNDSSPIFTEICSILPKTTTFGVYLHKDRFNNLIKDKLSQKETNISGNDFVFMVGAILPKENQSPEQQRLLKEKGYHYANLPEEVDNVVYCKFPYRGVLSVVVATRRVYAAIDNYVEKYRLCAYPKIEIYDKDDIYYILPLAQQSDFIELLSNGLDNVNNLDNAAELKNNADNQNVDNDVESESESNSASIDSSSSYEMIN